MIGESPIRQSLIDESAESLGIAPIGQSAIDEFSQLRARTLDEAWRTSAGGVDSLHGQG